MYPHEGIEKEIKSGKCLEAIQSVDDYLNAYHQGVRDVVAHLNNCIEPSLTGWGAERIADLHYHYFGPLYKDAGRFRKLGETVSFGGRVGADAQFITLELDDLQSESDTLASGILEATIDEKLRFLAAYHAKLVLIHPFLDGNGRLSRLVTDWMQRLLFPGTNTQPVPRKCYMDGMRRLPKNLAFLMNWLSHRMELEESYTEVEPPYQIHVNRDR